ncbi:DUF6478 family protein [Actibacterium lipolyticum]|uniref:Uncharacterized protein n=1 Tax=Actibacterium lipolyticum TaxID=1524263 RepID=A0A238JJ53_9RHOB|nr:DUF6478 family protein [Actibacterium lipolyticum]SMX30710.1 hypothetical protein COL8621_00071 [Actibacterium lipolyticum]
MAGKLDSLMERMGGQRALRRWSRAAEKAGAQDLSALREQRTHARLVRRQLNKVLHIADERLTLPAVGSKAIQMPMGSDWGYRPDVWRGALFPAGHAPVPSKAKLSDEATVHHDCNVCEIAVRQVRNTRAEDLAPFGLQLDVFRFEGTFLSLAIDLPKEASEGLQRRHIVRLEAIVELEHSLEIFARLNVKHGPNTEQIVREMPLGDVKAVVEFDLAYSEVNEKRVESMWLDLILKGPQMNQITLRDVSLSRRPRAEL